MSGPNLVSYIWNPVLSIENALSMVSVGRDWLRIYPGGVVEYAQRIQVISEAETDLRPFPFEKRNCTLMFSNGYIFIYTSSYEKIHKNGLASFMEFLKIVFYFRSS